MKIYFLIFLYALFGSFFAFISTQVYVNSFEKRLFNDSKNYLLSFLKPNNSNQAQIDNIFHVNAENNFIGKHSFSIWNGLLLFLFMFVFGLIYTSLNFSDINHFEQSQLFQISFWLFVIFYLSILAFIDYKTQWLTNESVFILVLLGFCQQIYFIEKDVNFIYLFAFFSTLILFTMLHTIFPQLPLGQGDTFLLSSFFLFFSWSDVLLGLGFSLMIGTVLGYLEIVLIALCFKTKIRKQRKLSFKKHLKSSRLLFKLKGEAFGQWLIVGVLISGFFNFSLILFP